MTFLRWLQLRYFPSAADRAREEREVQERRLARRAATRMPSDAIRARYRLMLDENIAARREPK